MALVIIEIEDEEDSVSIRTDFVNGMDANSQLTTSQALALELIRHAKEVLKPNEEEI
jgi:hypothetical protein